MYPFLIGLAVIGGVSVVALIPLALMKPRGADKTRLQRLQPRLRTNARGGVLGYDGTDAQRLGNTAFRKLARIMLLLAVMCTGFTAVLLMRDVPEIPMGATAVITAAVLFPAAVYAKTFAENMWVIDHPDVTITCSALQHIHLIPHEDITDYAVAGHVGQTSGLTVSWHDPVEGTDNQAALYTHNFDFRNLQHELCSRIARGEFFTDEEQAEPYEVRVQMAVDRISRLNDVFDYQVVDMQPYIAMVPRG